MHLRSVLVGWFLAVAGCGARTGEATPAEVEPARVETEVRRVETPAPVPEEARRSCRSAAAPVRASLSNPGAPVEVGERSFVLAWRRRGSEVERVLASLDARGELVITPVPVPHADPAVIGGDAGGLVIVSVASRGAGTLLRVAFDAEGVLRPGTPQKLPEVVWGWPSALESDGVRATLRHTTATAGQSLGSESIYTIDLKSQRVVATAQVPAGSIAACDASGCVTFEVAQDDASARTVVVRRGEERLEVPAACPGLHAPPDLWVAPGDPWHAVWLAGEAPFLRVATVDGRVAPAPKCQARLAVFPSRARPGVLDERESTRTLLRWEPAKGAFGAPEALPEMVFRRTIRAAHPDGVIEVGWSGGSGMTHSPTDAKGVRRYYTRWHFEGGQVSLLRYEGGAWRALERTPLVLANAEGAMHRGYEPIVLRHGLHAAVLLAPEGGSEEAWVQPYLAPCP